MIINESYGTLKKKELIPRLMCISLKTVLPSVTQ